ncbi:uncharacterized protein LOC123265328 [Cotesia glomerata]|uniref:TIL domain-containing protein n=1 Tax=Cotesia glomerata TaxID=32391 RepID=A0AAV7IXQ2_COTGL|nr:uncharacterized protein LOC123265328 [Cotesia glomerata]KAH0560554.1 hypothetical protein KQX54_005861 [Cotesia glomerata]
MDLTLESVLEINKQRIEAIPTGDVHKYYFNSKFRKITSYDCPANSSFTKIPQVCVPSCDDPDPTWCFRDNMSHCMCIEGYVKNATDDCIRIEDCPNIKLKSAEALDDNSNDEKDAPEPKLPEIEDVTDQLSRDEWIKSLEDMLYDLYKNQTSVQTVE